MFFATDKSFAVHKWGTRMIKKCLFRQGGVPLPEGDPLQVLLPLVQGRQQPRVRVQVRRPSQRQGQVIPEGLQEALSKGEKLHTIIVTIVLLEICACLLIILTFFS